MLEDAYEVCRKAHQPWRAASIRGSLLFRWNSLGTFERLLCSTVLIVFYVVNSPKDEDAMEDDDLKEGWRGNQRRKLWKTACTRAAMNVGFFSEHRMMLSDLDSVL